MKPNDIFKPMKLARSTLVLLCILGLAAFLRLFQLGDIPAGFTWDEAAITYDAWAIQTWHRDQYANFMPLSFTSFGDYKAPLLPYLMASLFFLTGPNEMLIRWISAISGIALVVITYHLVRSLFPKSKHLALLSALLVAISPWSIHISRIGLEANLALSLTTFALLAALRARKNNRWLYLAIIAWGLGLYTYQSTKITIPLQIGAIILLFWRQRVAIARRHLLMAIILGSLLVIPFGLSIKQGSLYRGQQALIFYSQGRFDVSAVTLKQLALNSLAHLAPDFLYKGIQENQRNITPGFGITYMVLVPCFFFGLIHFLKQKQLTGLFIVLLFGIGLVPSIIALPSPHTIRALGAMPFLQIIEASACIALASHIHNKTFFKKLRFRFKTAPLFMGVFAIALGFNAILFIYTYFIKQPSNNTTDFQFGYQQAVQSIINDGRDVSKIYMTDTYGQPYIYVLLYKRIKPSDFQAGALANMVFGKISWPNDREDALFVATPQEIPVTDPEVIRIINFPHSASPAWVIAKKPATQN